MVAFALVAVIAVCAILIVFGDLDKPWTVATQIGSAVAGAALGSILSVDFTRRWVENHIRPSIRRLFDQMVRLSALVERTEAFGRSVDPSARSSGNLQRAADRFENIGDHLRDEIAATASAIEDWGDLSRPVYDAELRRYQTRKDRNPDTPPAEGSST